MRISAKISSLLLIGGMLASCSTASKIEKRKHLAAAEQALEELEADAKKTPQQKLEELYQYNPSLRTKPTSVVRSRDTARTKEEAAGLALGPTSSPAIDRALAESILGELHKIGVVDSAASQAKQQAAAESLARTLGTRPTYGRDTATTIVGALVVRAWFDERGVLHAEARKLAEAIPVDKTVETYQPIREPTFIEKLWFAARFVVGLLGLAGLVFLFKSKSTAKNG